MDTLPEQGLQVWSETPEQTRRAAMRHLLAELFRYPPLISLVLANLIPLFGVAFLGWSLLSMVFLYWLESAVIGFYTVVKLAKVSGWQGIPFFIVHFGVFMLAHLIFILAIFGPRQPASAFPPLDLLLSTLKEVALAFVSLFVSHGISFFYNFLGNREFEDTDTEALMRAPYERIILMHATVFVSGWLSLMTRASIYGLVFMIFLKLASDIRAHLKEHSSSEEEVDEEEGADEAEAEEEDAGEEDEAEEEDSEES